MMRMRWEIGKLQSKVMDFHWILSWKKDCLIKGKALWPKGDFPCKKPSEMEIVRHYIKLFEKNDSCKTFVNSQAKTTSMPSGELTLTFWEIKWLERIFMLSFAPILLGQQKKWGQVTNQICNACGVRARVCGKSAKIWQNQIVTFPIKKRIHTDLFIDGKRELLIHERRIKNFWADLSECVVIICEHICTDV